MTEFHFSLSLTPSQYQAYYQGSIQSVRVKSLEGPVIQFPANLLRQFVSDNGIIGLFKITLDANNKCQEIIKLKESQ